MAKLKRIQIDQCKDANGHFTLRPEDGTVHGNTWVEPIATVYTKQDAETIVQAYNNYIEQM